MIYKLTILVNDKNVIEDIDPMETCISNLMYDKYEVLDYEVEETTKERL